MTKAPELLIVGAFDSHVHCLNTFLKNDRLAL